MERFLYVNAAGKSITIDYDSNSYILQSHTGLIPYTVQGYRQDGASKNGLQMGTRIMTISFLLRADTMQQLYERRRYLGAVFNPILGDGVLTYTNDYLSASITAQVTVQPATTEQYGLLQLYTVELTAYDPYFYDPAERALKMEDFVGGLRFPIRFAPTISFATRGSEAAITIVGDVPSPVKVEFSGDSVKPKITNKTTGEHIEINTTIATGDRLIVTTAYANKTATIYHADGSAAGATHLITPASTFFALKCGVNHLAFAAQSGSPEAYVRYRNRYVGV